MAVEHFGRVLVPGGGGAVGVQDQGPAPLVDYHLVEHSSTQSVTEVLPPLALCRVWFTSHAAAGWSHRPAHWQCRSRRITALRIPAGMVSE